MATKRVNIDIVAKDKSQQALKNVRGGLDKVKQSVFNVRNALAGLGGGLVIRNLVNTGKEIESLQVRLKFLFGSTQEGAKAFDEMAKFAAKVPFSLEQIQSGAGVLSVVSKDAEELADILEITGNVAAVTGLDFRTTSEQIQRSLSAGIASADLFREKGVRDLLGFKAGATVTAKETAEAFKKVFGKGGEFGGATDELAKTFEGTLSMIGDKFFTFKKTILEAGFFPELKKQFGDLDNFLAQNGQTIDNIAMKIGQGLAKAVSATGKAVIFLKDNFDTLITVIKTLIAFKLIMFFTNLATAIGASTAAMLTFNAAVKKNLLIGGAAIVIANLEKILGLTKQIMGISEDKPLEVPLTLPAETPMPVDMLAKETKSIRKEKEKQLEVYRQFGHLMSVQASRDAVEQAKINKEGLKQITTNTKDALQAVSGLNKTAFEAYKRFQIAEATINAIKAASNAFQQFPFPINIGVAASALAKGLALVAQIKSTSFREKGGPVSQGKPFIVGEKGPELFVPNQSGNIVANNKMGGSPVAVTFNINTVDARGFNELLTNSRGTIVSLINSAVNETGRQAVV